MAGAMPRRAHDRLRATAVELLDVARGCGCGYVTLTAFVDRSTGHPTLRARLYRVNRAGTVAETPSHELRERL